MKLPFLPARWQHALKHVPDVLRRIRYFPLTERKNWYDNMEMMLSADVVTKDALIELASRNRQFGRPAAVAYQNIFDAYHSGADMAVATERWVTPLESIFLTAVDSTKSPAAYGACGRLMGALQQMRLTLLATTAYPTLLLVSMLIVMRIMGDKFIDSAKQLKEFASLPADLRAYVAFVDWVGHHQLLLYSGLAALALLNLIVLNRWTGPSRTIADTYWPPLRIYRAYTGAAMILCLAALLKAKLTIDDALRAISRHAGGYLRHHVESILVLYRDGPNAADAFDTGLLDHDVLVRISALARTGGLPKALELTGDSVLQSGQRAITRAAALYFFTVLVIVGLFLIYTVTFFNAVGQAAAGNFTN